MYSNDSPSGTTTLVAALKPSTRRKFARRCKELRDAIGRSQMWVARNSDIGLSHYQRLESGELDPRLSTLLRLAEIYGVTVSALVDGL